ncbi:MAG: hypothetical protein V4641_05580 [Pseudomonadota bacterium]
MTVQFSTGLLTHNAVTGSKKAALDGGFLFYFSGPVPASADAAVDGTTVMLAKISLTGGATGLTFEATAPGGILSKTAAEAWQCTSAAATGTATFFRFCDSADAGTALSTTAKRIQGTLGTTMASDGQLVSTAITAGQALDVPLFQVS